ncbi:hypothetical protein BT93_H3689 [Corymbia citriodora subsp. variegata]|nr:hypothetical protein BT93_H3689 [Corymbia citriodora subsp. variegata]
MRAGLHFLFSVLSLLRVCAAYMAREEDGGYIRRGRAAFQEHDVLKMQLSQASALPWPRRVYRHQGPGSGMKAFFLDDGTGGPAYSCPVEQAINPVVLLY